jgi:hypothetical protein
MTDEWQDTSEEDGITLGPEAALEREIAKSKALKVERLQLRDQVDRLTAQNKSLIDENEALKQNLENFPGNSENTPDAPNSRYSGVPQPDNNRFLPNRWAFILLIFNLAAIGILLLFLLQKPSP